MTNPILQYSDLINVPVRDNEERLLEVRPEMVNIVCEYQKPDMVPYVGNRFFLREGVIDRLRKASANLYKVCTGYRFKLVYAYRHPDVQARYFETRKAEILVLNPELSPEEARNRAHLLSASPDVAGHPTGGAIDITIIDERGIEIDMGTKIADFSEGKKIQTSYPLLTEQQKSNRILLRTALMKQGFAPFDGEWWHFSYGDREWAKYYEQKCAVYDQVASCNLS